MTPERWREIEALYHSAREQGRQVLEGCDPELRGQVEELLIHDATGRLLDLPVTSVLSELAEPETGLTGRRIAQYEVLERLGAGGMGVVYKSRDTKLNRLVALKFLPPEFRHDADFRRRLAEEARAASALDHPNIVVIHEIHETAGEFFIAMAYHEGATLRERMSGPIDGKEALAIARQVAAGLSRAHEHGVTHRDIKPSNLIVGRDGVVRIIDFGLARPADGTGSREEVLRGTPQYMSPEQVSGQRVDARTDIWSLGVVLYQMLAGTPPFRGENVFALMRAIVEEQPASLKDVPAPLAAVVSRALEKDPARRFRTAGEMEAALASGNVAARRPLGRPLAAVAGLVAVVAGSAIYYGKRTPTLPAARERVVVADVVDTADPAFDGRVLRRNLALQLAPELDALPEDRIHTALERMRKPKNTRLTPDIAREICERTASKAVIESTVADLGTGHGVRVLARNCATGTVMEELQQRTPRKEDLAAALDAISGSFRQAVSAALVRTGRPAALPEVTTDSLEALKSYHAARETAATKGFAEGIPLLERAIEMDPQFAMAYSHLGRHYADMGENAIAQKHMTRAYDLRAGVSDIENFYVTYNYQRNVARNLELGLQTLEAWARKYPRDPGPLSFLSGLTAAGTGRYEAGIEAAKQALELLPGHAIVHLNLADCYLRLMRLQDAEATVGQSIALGRTVPDTYLFPYALAFLRGDRQGMEKAARERAGQADHGLFAFQEASALAYQGRIREARSRGMQAVSQALQLKLAERAAVFRGGIAVWEALAGNRTHAKEASESALKAIRGRDADYGPAFALALVGESSRALTVAKALGAEFPDDTPVQFKYLPAIEGMVALNRGAIQQAVDLTLRSAPYDHAQSAISIGNFYGTMDAVYVRGLAYARAGEQTAAAAEFQKIVDHPGVMLMDPVGPLARLQLARAFSVMGESAKAEAAYAQFLKLWNDADADLPVLAAARAEASTCCKR